MSRIVGHIVRRVCSSRFVLVYGLFHNLMLLALFSWMVNYRGRPFDVDGLFVCLIGCVPYLINAAMLHHHARRGLFSKTQAVLTGAILILGLGALLMALVEVIRVMLEHRAPPMPIAAFVAAYAWLIQWPIVGIALITSAFRGASEDSTR
jgi:hypothetical protein